METWCGRQINHLRLGGNMPFAAAENIIERYGKTEISDEDQKNITKIARALIEAIKEDPKPSHLGELISALETLASHDRAICQALATDPDQRFKDMGDEFLRKYHA